jgi:type IV secretion system protein VirB3
MTAPHSANPGDSFRDPFFKGCTRPAMFPGVGVPLLPFLLVTGVFILAGMWLFYLASGYVTLLLLLIYIPLMAWMRQVTKKDDQRLSQLLKRARMRVRQQAGKALWGAVSFSPIRYKRRKA